ncbi:hypothetical protein BI291_17210 [Thalassotalea sp. PP2-459]|nr:hypothetical protein BI291_17210 [Thalassotalea sp. PP2-459]
MELVNLIETKRNLIMRELSMNELTTVNGGAALILWTILLLGHEALNELGRGIGAGVYDATH